AGSASNQIAFSILGSRNNSVAFSGQLKPRPDKGFPFRCDEEVLEADFSELRTPSEYRLSVAGLGASFPFWIGDQSAAALARAYALGLYHQRCSTNNVLPYTRYTHAPCHIARASVPLPLNQFSNA